VTYPIGEDVAVPGLRFISTARVPGLRRIKIGPSLAKLPLDALLLWEAARQLRRCRYDPHREMGMPAPSEQAVRNLLESVGEVT
jgi:hypothetical protein